MIGNSTIQHESVARTLRLLNSLEKKYESVPRQSRDRLILLHLRAVLETVERNYAMLMAREIDRQAHVENIHTLLKAAVAALDLPGQSSTIGEIATLLSTTDKGGCST